MTMGHTFDAEGVEIKIPALGRTGFRLGSLYDIRSENISSFNLWSTDAIEQGKKKKHVPYTRYDVKETNSFKEKADMLKISGKLSIGLFSNLIKIEGSGEFLKDNKESSQSCSVTLHYEKLTREEWIPNEMFANRTCFTYPENLDKGDFTHVIVGIDYGGKAFFSFEKEFSTDESELDAGADLKAKINKIPTTSIEVEGTGKYKQTDKTTSHQMNCKYFGDFELNEIPGSFEEAVHTYRNLPRLIADDKAVPVHVRLMPLKKLESRIDRIIVNIENHIIEKCSEEIENINQIKSSIKTISKSRIGELFNAIKEKCDKFGKYLGHHETAFQSKLKELLPKISFGDTAADIEINQLFSKIAKSPFSSHCLKKWILQTEEETAMLEKMINMIEKDNDKVKMCKTIQDVKKESEKQSFDFTIKIVSQDKFLEQLRKYLETDGSYVRDASAEITSALLDDKIFAFNLLERYRNFSLANNTAEDKSFLIRPLFEQERADVERSFNVVITDAGRVDFSKDIISEPLNVIAFDKTHNSCCLAWESPDYGKEDVRQYHVMLFLVDQSQTVLKNEFNVAPEKLEAVINKLDTFQNYKAEIKAITKYGVSPSSSVEFETLPCEPVSNIEAIHIGNSFLDITWTPPTQSKSNLEGFKIFIVQLPESKTDDPYFVKEMETQEPKATLQNLKPLKEYNISISVLTEKGMSIESHETFCTTDEGGFPGDILKSLWNVLKSAEFSDPQTPDDIIKQLDRLMFLKKNAENEMEGNIELWVHQMIISKEFKKFIQIVIQKFSDVEIYYDTRCRGVLKDLLLPFDEKKHPKNNKEIIFLFNWLCSPDEDEYSHLSFDVISDFKIFLSKKDIKDTNSFESNRFKKSIYKFLQNIEQNYDKLECYIILMLCKKYGMEEKDIFESDINILPLVTTFCDFDEIMKSKNKKRDTIVYEANCLQFALQHNEDKYKVFVRVKQILSNKFSNSQTLEYMEEFLSNWNESNLDEFLKILKSTRDFTDFYKTFRLTEDVKEKLSDLTIKLKEKNKYINDDNETRLLKGKMLDTKVHNQFEEVFARLKFKKYLKESLTRQEVYSIDTDEEHKTASMLFLKKLLSLDYRCREQEKVENQFSDKNSSESNSNTTAEAFFFDTEETEISDDKKFIDEDYISSEDIMLTTLVACGHILLQDVFEKMSLCQIAIPIIFPNPKLNREIFNLWALRSIKKKWFQSSTGASKETNIVTQKCKTISFCRFGDLQTSKSKIVNDFISTVQKNPEHSYFLHRDNDSKSLLNDGVIEACWYTPINRADEKFKDLTCIYNLRGDIRTHEVKLDILLAVSSVVVVFLGEKLTSDITKKFMSSKKPLILVEMTAVGKEKKMGSMKKIFGKNKTVKEVAEIICRSLDMDSTEYVSLSLEDHATKARSFGIFVDEDYPSCRKGKSQANKIIHIFDRYSIENIKRNVVPLQGDLWRQLSENDKEQFRQKCRQDNVDPSEYSRDVKEKNRRIREEQRLLGPSEALFSFLESMITLSGDSLIYYLDYVQFYLNQNSEKYLPELLKRYNACTKELDDKKEKMDKLHKNSSSNEDTSEKKKLQEEVDLATEKVKLISKQFDTASFGIEHIFREIAQVYESFEASENAPVVVKELPQLMVELLLKGYPLEIMDGNVSQVPLLWLEKVLTSLEKSIKEIMNENNPLSESREPRVFVSSILGIQSSGKSTFLNTMYGSKFPVSSGRCTRGVFIQLLPVKEECRNKMNCDYYILMDSEGLRSPELGDSYNHDNEIATLISCLANTTIINFWGQNFSKDMTDVILIAAFAYIRMAQVKIKSSFHLVFACVQDVTAKDKNQFALKKTMESLNQMVLDVAKSQGRHDLFRGLESIFPMLQESYREIEFPQFFPSLWHDSMSPPASMYGEMVHKLKIALTNVLSKGQGNKHAQPIREFLNRLKEVWRAIKMENFIFGFRNTQALQDFNKLQMCYERKLKELRDLFYNQEAWNIEASFMAEMSKEANKQNAEQVMKIYENKIEMEFIPKFEAEKEKIKKYLLDEISKLSNPDNGMMYLSTFKIHLDKTVAQLLDRERSRVLTNIKVTLKADVSAEEKQKFFKKQFLAKARQIAIEVKKNQSATFNDVAEVTINQDLINEKFESLFDGFLQDAQKRDRETFGDTDNIHMQLFSDCLHCLIDKIISLRIPNQEAINKEITESKKGNEPIINLTENDINSGKWYRRNKSFVIPARERMLSINKFVMTEIKKASVAKNVSYNKVLTNIIDHVFEEMGKENNPDKWFFEITYRMPILVSYYGYVIKKLADIQMRNFKKYSLEKILTDEKEKLRREFEKDCNTANMDNRTVETYYKDVLIPSILKRIKLALGNEIYNDVMSSEMFSTKNMMMFHVQKELLDATANDVSEFSNDFDEYVTNWINQRVIDYCHKINSVRRKIEKQFYREKDDMINCLQETAVKAKNEGMETSTWYTTLLNRFMKKPMVQDISAQKDSMVQIGDVKFATAQMIQYLQDTKASGFYDLVLSDDEKDMDERDQIEVLLDWFDHKPLENICEERLGCTEQCVFCGAKCTSGIKCVNQKHTAGNMHRSQGFTGRHDARSEKLETRICTDLVSSNVSFKLGRKNKEKYGIKHENFIPYKEAKNIINDWFIPLVPEADSTDYWQYLFVRHHEKIAALNGCKPADLPKGWSNVTREDALRCLKTEYNIN